MGDPWWALRVKVPYLEESTLDGPDFLLVERKVPVQSLWTSVSRFEKALWEAVRGHNDSLIQENELPVPPGLIGGLFLEDSSGRQSTRYAEAVVARSRHMEEEGCLVAVAEATSPDGQRGDCYRRAGGTQHSSPRN